jgi:hypothetical protein
LCHTVFLAYINISVLLLKEEMDILWLICLWRSYVFVILFERCFFWSMNLLLCSWVVLTIWSLYPSIYSCPALPLVTEDYWAWIYALGGSWICEKQQKLTLLQQDSFIYSVKTHSLLSPCSPSNGGWLFRYRKSNAFIIGLYHLFSLHYFFHQKY